VGPRPSAKELAAKLPSDVVENLSTSMAHKRTEQQAAGLAAMRQR
jgi:hypothetical protein